jgi:8-oxo-dGTP pyrophosphatase MutT (NUDIX family)
VNRQTEFAAQLVVYARRWPEEAATVAQFWQLLDESDLPFHRTRLAGHFTGSAWLVSADGCRALFTHHRKLSIWVQLGGHADGDADLARVALKEAQEESGLRGLRLEPELFDIDRHWIPECGNVPGHWHYDTRYVVRAGADENFVVSEESHALAWHWIGELVDDADADLSLRRMAGKWLESRDP